MAGPWEQFKEQASAKQQTAPTEGPKPWEQFAQAPSEMTSDKDEAANISQQESAARGAAQGATLGFGDELSAAAGALMPTATDKALGRGYGDRYSSIRDQIRSENADADLAHPVVSALSEIIGSLPVNMATGAGLAGLGRGTVRTAATQGAAYGFGKGEGEITGQLEDAAKAGLLSAGIAKGIDMLSPNSALAKITKKGSDYEIKYGAGLKDSFKIGQEMQSAISNPQTQQAISRELNDQQGNISKVIQTTKQALGQKWAPLMEQHGDAVSDVKDVFSKIYNKVGSIAPEGDDLAVKAQEALTARIKGIEDQLLQSSPSGSLSEVPLKALANAQEALGNIVFEQGAYRKIPAVNGAAKNFFGMLSNAFEKADVASGSGGDLTNINKVFSTLYKMQENKLSGAALKSLASDPQSTAALKAYDSFIKPLADLQPGVRASLAPELESYISNDFQKSLLKAQVMKTITGRGPSTTNEGIIGWALKKAYLSPATFDNTANKLGALSGKIQNNAAVKGSLNILKPLAPTIGALAPLK